MLRGAAFIAISTCLYYFEWVEWFSFYFYQYYRFVAGLFAERWNGTQIQRYQLLTFLCINANERKAQCCSICERET